MLILTVVPLFVYTPPLGLVKVHDTELKFQLVGIVSVTMYVWNFVMLLKTFVFAVVPSSTSGKFVNGAGEAVKGKLVGPLGVASLTIVIEPGKVTASAESERS